MHTLGAHARSRAHGCLVARVVLIRINISFLRERTRRGDDDDDGDELMGARDKNSSARL